MRSRTLFPAAVLFALPLFASSYPGFGTYTYDGAGNVIAVGGHTFVYDRSSRIEKATLGTGRSAEYTYDRYGNILTITTDGDWSSRGKPGVNRLTNRIDQTVDENGFGNNMIGTYDGAGNLRTYNGSTTFVYDALDTITESNVDGVRRLYLYSATNERIAVVAMAGSTPLRWDWTIRDTNGKVLRRFSKDQANTWSWDQDYIYRSGQLLAAEKPADTLHFHLDHLGTPRVISNRNGGLVSQHTYYPFGRELTSPFQDTEAMKFTGHERDSANLDYMHARSYLPYTGRFLSVDRGAAHLRRPQSWNRYSYAHNNPGKYVDPDGNIPVETVIDVASLGASAYSMATAPSWANLGYLAWDAAATAVPYVPGSWVAKVGKYGHRGLQAVGGKLDALETAVNDSLVREGVALLGQGDDSVKQVLGLSRVDSAADFLGVTQGGTFKIVEAKGSNVGAAVSQIAATAAALKAKVSGGVSFTAELALRRGQRITGDYRVVGNHLQRFNSSSNRWERVLVDGNQVTVRYY